VERPDRQEVDRKQATAVMAALRRAMKSRLDSGLLPYDGKWVPLSAVQEGIAQERKRAWIHAIELILLYCLNTVLSGLIIALVWQICY
jgi:hypothetical protein